VTDGPTDHASRSVTIDCIYIHSTAMRSNNKNNVMENYSVEKKLCSVFTSLH